MGADDVRENFRCRLCGGGDLVTQTLQHDGERLQFFRCRECKLVNREMTAALAADLAGAIGDVNVDPSDDTAPTNLSLDRSFRFLARYLSPPGRLLDVGCGNGRLMYVARRAGWDVKGLERSSERAQRVRERLGAAVVVAHLAQLDPDAIDAVKFDVLYLHAGLEQVPDCVAAMTKLRSLLVPSGHVVLDLNNARSLSSTIERSGDPRGSRAVASHGNPVANAVNLFSRRSFEFLLRRTGFDLVQWETYSDSPLADWIFRYVPLGRYARALIRKQSR